MSDDFFHPLPGGSSKSPDEVAKALDEACRNLAALLTACSDSAAVRRDLLARIPPRVLALLEASKTPAPPKLNPNTAEATEVAGPPVESPDFVMTPEFLEWARGQFSEEELAAGLRELEGGGGLELRDFIHELEQAAREDD